jgi:2-phospho-L-lactate guanylyltransferase
MTLWAIIPVKPFVRAKSRLSAVLTPDERSQLAETLMRHVLTVVRGVPQVAGTLVISRDSKVLAIARDFGAYTVMESGQPELNHALMRATEVVRSWKSSAVLILPADLPLIAAEDVSAMIDLGRNRNTVVIATDDDEDGTNAMLVRPPGLMPYQYGPGSFHRHIETAKQAGAVVRHYDSERLKLDIDLPEDLERYNRVIKESY